jgi:hypothetical protein
MSYLDMLNVLMHMNEVERRAAIAEHRHTFLSHGFVGFILGVAEAPGLGLKSPRPPPIARPCPLSSFARTGFGSH